MVNIPVIQQDAGLIRGIEQATGALGQALQHRMIEQSQADKTKKGGLILNEILSQLPTNASIEQYQSAIGQAIQRGVPTEVIKQMTDLYKPVLEQRAKAAEAQNFLNTIFPQLGAVPGQPGQPGMGMANTQPALSPMQQVKQGMSEEGRDEALKQAQFDITAVPEASLMKLMLSPYKQHQQLAEAELKRRELETKRFDTERKFAAERALPYLKDIDKERDSLSAQETALSMIDYALSNRDMSFFSPDNFAQFLGRYGEGLKTPEGALLMNAQKEFLLGSIQRAGSRPNQWIEQQISQMLLNVGRSQEANEAVKEALKSEVAVRREKVRAADEIASQEKETKGYISDDIAAKVDKRVKEFADAEQKKLGYKLRVIHEKDSGLNQLRKEVKKKVPPGTPLTPIMFNLMIEEFKTPDQALKNAKAMGYTVYSPAQIQEFTK